MKTICYTPFRIFLFGMIAFIFIFSIQVHAAAKPLQVAIVPFKVNAEKDLSFLRDGIVDMLSSRLSWPDKVTVINSQETLKVLKTVTGSLNEIKAREMGAKLGADFVLFGSLTVIGNSVSIDAKMVDVSGEKETLSFFNQSQGMDPVIPSINLFASDINEKEFGRVMETRRVAPSAGPSSTRTEQAQPDVRAHPDKLLAGRFSDADSPDSKKTAPSSSFIPTERTYEQAPKFWRSQSFSHLINGLALGDVDGDGKQETVILTPHAVHIYRWDNNRFVKVKIFDENRYRNLIGIDIADINQNGISELFVTSLNAQRNSLNSFVIERNGKDYKEIVTNSPWYYRVVELSGQGPLLFGQRQGTADDPFGDAIFEMVWNNNEYEPADQILPSRRANLMGFALGDVMNDGRDIAVSYNQSDYIRIIDGAGKVEWTGSENYGGSMLYFSLPRQDPGEIENPSYLPMRIDIRDLNADGKNEIIAVKNFELANRRLENFREFTNTQIELLSWNGLGLDADWKTRKVSGYISDFGIGDFDNDGRYELIAAVISRQGSIIGTTPKSYIIAYDLGPNPSS